MNNLHGKFSQRIPITDYKVDNISNADNWTEQGYKIRMRFGFDYLLTKTIGVEYGRSFAPILSAYTTAYARHIMYEEMKKIPKEDLLYIGTDGLVYKGQHENKFNIGTEIGQFKIVKKDGIELKNVEIRIYGKNNYIIGGDRRISGIRKDIINKLTIKQIEKPFVFKKFKGINEASELDDVYGQREDEKNLIELRNKTKNLIKYMETKNKIKDAGLAYDKFYDD